MKRFLLVGVCKFLLIGLDVFFHLKFRNEKPSKLIGHEVSIFSTMEMA